MAARKKAKVVTTRAYIDHLLDRSNLLNEVFDKDGLQLAVSTEHFKTFKTLAKTHDKVEAEVETYAE